MRGWVWGALALAAAMAAGQARAQGTTTPGAEVVPSTRDNITLGLAIFGAFTGLVGAALGVVNTWNTLSLRRLRVEVTPAFVMTEDGMSPTPLFSIGVANLSTFAVSAEEVGFMVGKGGRRTPVTVPRVLDGKPWPRQLGARESVSLYFDPSPYMQHAKHITGAYVRLASGEIITGTSPALKQLVEMMREIASGRG